MNKLLSAHFLHM